MFTWFVQGLEKVMPRPVSREERDTQVCCLMDRERAREHHSPGEQGVPCCADDTRSVLGPAVVWAVTKFHQETCLADESQYLASKQQEIP